MQRKIAFLANVKVKKRMSSCPSIKKGGGGGGGGGGAACVFKEKLWM